jgi:hypothetical protein
VIEALRPGLWTWAARHPDWTEDEGGPEGWGPEVRSYALDTADALVLFDPLGLPPELLELVGDRPVEILLTVYWHRRASLGLVTDRGAIVRASVAGIDQLAIPATPFRLGDRLTGGVEVRPGGYDEEAIFWIPAHGALVVGDALLGERGFRVQPDSWLADGLTPETLREQLRPLLALPVELLLPTHGDPVTEDAHAILERALAP